VTKLTFILPDGTERELEAKPGLSVMETAVQNNIEGIVAECGGSMSCATCHVFLDEASLERIGGPGETESDMLDFAATERRPTSRLSCQIKVGPEIEGALISIPERQY